jgi:7,8-dihydro-6-hydroxymethylpterin-pyrophosphokinase
LDLIVYDGLVVEEPDLRLPDPDIRQRAFVAGPAAELWPDYVLPESGESLRRLAGAFAAGLEVIPGFREAVLERIVS